MFPFRLSRNDDPLVRGDDLLSEFLFYSKYLVLDRCCISQIILMLAFEYDSDSFAVLDGWIPVLGFGDLVSQAIVEQYQIFMDPFVLSQESAMDERQ